MSNFDNRRPQFGDEGMNNRPHRNGRDKNKHKGPAGSRHPQDGAPKHNRHGGSYRGPHHFEGKRRKFEDFDHQGPKKQFVPPRGFDTEQGSRPQKGFGPNSRPRYTSREDFEGPFDRFASRPQGRPQEGPKGPARNNENPFGGDPFERRRQKFAPEFNEGRPHGFREGGPDRMNGRPKQRDGFGGGRGPHGSRGQGNPPQGRGSFGCSQGPRGERPGRDGDSRREPRRGFNNRGGRNRDSRPGFDGRQGARHSGPRGGFDNRGPRGPRGGQQDDFRQMRRERFNRKIEEIAGDLRGLRPDDDITGQEIPGFVRAQLRSLQPENAERVSKHLAMTLRHLAQDPTKALKHALKAVETAGRIAPVREAAGVTAYEAGEYKTALSELRTHRRMSGADDHIALIADSLRGVGKPEKAIELLEEALQENPSHEQKVNLSIVLSGAHGDLEDYDQAKKALEIPELDKTVAFPYSPRLFRAYAEVLEELDQQDEAQQWHEAATKAEDALGLVPGDSDIVDLLDDDEDEEEIPPNAAADAVAGKPLQREEDSDDEEDSENEDDTGSDDTDSSEEDDDEGDDSSEEEPEETDTKGK
ncbi:MAG: hypothetical protein QM632_05510 [Micrococcaceae bacterium]